MQATINDSATAARALYIDLLKRTVLRSATIDFSFLAGGANPIKRSILKACDMAGYKLVKPVNSADREEGKDWPVSVLTMVGQKRMDNIQFCSETVLKEQIPGDFIEAGVWRGGSCIFMRGILKAYGEDHRSVWVADSFEGLPKPTTKADLAIGHDYELDNKILAVSVENVRENFARVGLLDDNVKFLKGWFRDTLPKLPATNQYAVVRLDGDYYESIMDGLVHLYPRLSPGGFMIIDDYHCIDACKQAVDEYRSKNGIREPLTQIDFSGSFWRKSK
jgi:hypothetical protein